MKSKKIYALSLTFSLLLCSCGTSEEVTNVNISLPEQIQENMADNTYFDTADLSYAGTETQNIAIGYDFENPEDNDPVLTYDKYTSESGATFCFDTLGRLCQYERGTDTNTSEANPEATKATSRSNAELEQLSMDIAESLLSGSTELEVTSQSDTAFMVTNKASIGENEAPFTAMVDLDGYGDIETVSVSYNTLSAPIDYAYFQQKLDAYLESATELWDYSDYTYEVRYQQIADKIYGMYTVTFEASDGTAWCECPAFTQTV